MSIASDDPRVLAIVDLPYLRLISRDEDGGYTASIAEFPGCLTSGRTTAEAATALDEVFPGFVALMLEHDDEVPEPLELGGYSGRLTFRITPSLHAAAARRAAFEHVSLNRLLAEAVARYVGLTGPGQRSLPPTSPGAEANPRGS